MGSRRFFALAVASSLLALGSGSAALAAGGPPPSAPDRGGPDVVHVMASRAAGPRGGKTPPPLAYRGGAVSTNPAVYVVFWGSQWSTDPQHLQSLVPTFLSGIGSGESWSRSTTQYCMGVATGATSCTAGAGVSFAGQPAKAFVASWADGSAAAPSHPSQSQLAAEAASAARHFGITASTAALGSVQIVVATAHNNNATGFGTSYCAWHSSTTYSDAGGATGKLAYTNLPYMPDAGGSCGANFVNSGTLGAVDGVSIVEGHEYAETVTDPFPSSGWLDSGGAENGDKCAWISSGAGATTNVALTNGTYPVQSLWSNAANGCVQSS